MSHVKVLLWRGEEIHSVWSVWGGLERGGFHLQGNEIKIESKGFIKLL